MNNFSKDSFGRIQGIGGHDSILNFLDASQEHILKLGFVSDGGHQKTICIEGIKKLFVNNFREGNIIDSFYLWPITLIPKNILDSVFRSSFGDELKNAVVQSQKNNFLFFLECSFGAELCAIIESDLDMNDYLSCKMQFM